MRYLEPGSGIPDWPGYLAYLHSIRPRLPEHVWHFAADDGHYNLHERRSLHDAWLMQCSVQESAEGPRLEIRQTDIRLTLLGSWHDRHIHLHYLGVRHYSLTQPPQAQAKTHAHGDVLMHELTLDETSGLLLHELVFAHGARWHIACQDMRHWQHMLDAQP